MNHHSERYQRELDRIEAAPVARNILRTAAVLKVVGVSRSTLYRMIRKGEFPDGIRLSEFTVGWPREWIDSWVEQRKLDSAA